MVKDETVEELNVGSRCQMERRYTPPGCYTASGATRDVRYQQRQEMVNAGKPHAEALPKPISAKLKNKINWPWSGIKPGIYQTSTYQTER